MNIELTFLSNPLFLFFVGIIGLFAHCIKKYKRNQLDKKYGNTVSALVGYYVKSDSLSTIYSFIGYLAGFLGAMKLGHTDIMTVFMLGYLCDSIFNKGG